MSPNTAARLALAGKKEQKSPTKKTGGLDETGRPIIQTGQALTEGQAMTYFNIAMKEFEDKIGELMARTPESYPEYNDPLNYNKIPQSVAEWNEAPPVVVENFLHMQHHHETVVNYMKTLADDETTSELRRHHEERFLEDENMINKNKDDYLDRFT